MLDAQGRLVLKNLTFPELEEWCLAVEKELADEERQAAAGEAAPSSPSPSPAPPIDERARRRAVQVWRWLYSWDATYEAVDDLNATLRRQGGLSAKFLARVRGRATADAGLRLERAVTSADGTTKLVFAVLAPATSSSHSSSSMARVAAASSAAAANNAPAAANNAPAATSSAPAAIASGAVETVIIPVERTRRGKARATLCLSSQIGCAQACQFCYTGRMGLLASLSAAQVVQQAIEAKRWLLKAGGGGGKDQGRQQRRRGQQQQARGDGSGDGDGAGGNDNPEQQRPRDGDGAGGGGGDSGGSPETPPLLPPQLVGATVTNVVFMGTGEPGAVWRPSVAPAIDVLTHPLGLALSHNKVTVSTVGLISFMRDFFSASAADGGGGQHHQQRAQLALSLHATTDEVRDWIVPVNRAQGGLAALREALLELFPLRARSAGGGSAADDDDEDEEDEDDDEHAASSHQPGVGRPPQPNSARRARRRLLIEYVMLKNINDTESDAHRLVAFLSGVDAKINLIAFNPHEGTRFRGSDPDQIARFRGILTAAGRVCTVRDSRGGDEAAACGQLGDVTLARSVRGALAPMLEPPEAFRAALAVPPFSFSAMGSAETSSG
jgi:23S rRNA (adenine2503-C2)-methyltransferase